MQFSMLAVYLGLASPPPENPGSATNVNASFLWFNKISVDREIELCDQTKNRNKCGREIYQMEKPQQC